MMPAMASDPYWAAAPSRSTSTRSTARRGMVPRSTPELPRPTVPLLWSSELWCSRLPLTSTSTWSGLRPRRVKGGAWSVPSVMLGRGALKPGTSMARARCRSGWPVDCSWAAVMMSMGTSASSASRAPPREPTAALAWVSTRNSWSSGRW